VAFGQLKKLASGEMVFTFPNYSLPFELYADASKLFQLGAVIMADLEEASLWPETAIQKNNARGRRSDY
jgi:hypothetical protein